MDEQSESTSEDSFEDFQTKLAGQETPRQYIACAAVFSPPPLLDLYLYFLFT
jgi:hypothetical protein